jgi:mono/diheme cytochrome c family protein
MSMLKTSLAAATVAGIVFAAVAFAAEAPGLGEPIVEADVGAWDINIFPDGTGLPMGSGTARQGAPIFAAKCASCHGAEGSGGFAAAIEPGPPRATLDGPKTVANFWPYATTIFDFIRRAMPPLEPTSLTDDETYALTAYVLFLNELIGEDEEINSETLPEIELPNRDNFIIRFPERI